MPTPRKYETAAQRQAAYRQRCRQRQISTHSDAGLTLAAIPPAPGHRRWKAMSHQATCILEKALTEMEAYYDDKPERWQDSEKGEALCQTIETLEEAVAAIKELL